ncbi:hypothetical protein DFH08DRAFT_972269 [Mycena albidolilacea]|uniref:Uncharacterized protein n=1 Tax=Mycena albidolilacea TaxID=1033008 RepID=A0AAD6ZBM7_9AGAR|nr:hypothetical protein DFH08DRAFT_972269 [Mycena albidolilacea]
MSEKSWYSSVRRRRRSQLSGSRGVMTGNRSEVWTSLSGMHTVLGATERAPMFPMAAVCALVTTGTAIETVTVADAVTIEAGFTLLARPDDGVLAVDEFTSGAFSRTMGWVDVAANEAAELRLRPGRRDLESVRIPPKGMVGRFGRAGVIGVRMIAARMRALRLRLPTLRRSGRPRQLGANFSESDTVKR